MFLRQNVEKLKLQLNFCSKRSNDSKQLFVQFISISMLNEDLVMSDIYHQQIVQRKNETILISTETKMIFDDFFLKFLTFCSNEQNVKLTLQRFNACEWTDN